ncbi:hypothetical protein HPP92_007857 [Vanilla planifolia]|uniref:Pyridoxal phosphate homeostasis protein n=1 Tax=Vanilla planifolia TaxID=51239 RepID=A0A835RL08_VANPL|nr:hypothetical protein HPP92_007857 [Vanilla planifolia]
MQVQRERWDSTRLIGSGGMPSSHSATVVALATAIGLQEGVDASSFALAAVLASVVMYDASGIRLHAGRQAELLNQILCELPPEHPLSSVRPLRELLGHTPVQLPDDINWHFIGHIQSNKVKPLLAAVPNLDMVESVDSEKIAIQLDRMVASLGRRPLKVFLQVNTSGEESKSGVHPSECIDLVKHIKLSCPNLVFCGLMTIGKQDYSSTRENFQTLCCCKDEVCKALGIPEDYCELSMGMSGDFEQAIEMGSTNVRIGSTIFGPREYPKKEKKESVNLLTSSIS